MKNMSWAVLFKIEFYIFSLLIKKMSEPYFTQYDKQS